MDTDSDTVTTPVPDEGELRDTLALMLGVKSADISGDDNLILLGLTSMEIMRMVGHWRRTHLPVVFEELVATPTVNGWLGHFATLRTDRGR